MKDPRTISILDYTYSLPEERIAKYPLAERDASKLLIYKEGKIAEDHYRNIADHLPENSLLLFNNTKVVEARLLFQKPTGGMIEIFCLEPHEQYPDITTAMLQKEKVLWHCLVGGASKWKAGQILEKKIKQQDKEITLYAKYREKRSGSFIIELSWSPGEWSFAEVLHLTGAIPLPPYIKRSVEESDKERYQTVYAEADGSVAAPTAGLHFTENILNQLKEKNIQTGFVTLHVGAGTFQPVKAG
ncbi:MAG TPA: S-adenosylmethionine:tRNA ribosyltransferase-isomerase, partial [Chitinophagaceae bacterium]|nr:S-adenosylmethionine:tRNA ribosyltransferase-isomerase [Chitinophagaceae bacterium]